MSNLPTVDEANFESTVSSGLTVVDFFAQWCGPCKVLGPIMDEVAGAVSGKAKCVQVDVDQAQGLATKFGVTSIPTVVFFKDGSEVDRFVGIKQKDEIISLIEKH